MIVLKSDHEIDLMKKAGNITAKAHDAVKRYIKPGMSTSDLDKLVEDVILTNDATPAFKGYMGFPKSICSSINDEVVHGIPDKKTIINDGDIVSVDIGAFYDGYVGDQAKTYMVGNVSDTAKKLVEVTRQSFFEGLKCVKEGYRISDISREIQNYAESHGFSLVRDYTGHGVGQEMHEDPAVPNYVGPRKGPRLLKGMTIAIEPMVNEGTYDVHVLDNGWTVVTDDGKLSAHYEHSVAVTDGEPIILTLL
ncbi:type I methionyl aminopeptidase [Anaerofustis stercorihominis]|uniref:Methionine aminopeptidase n=1 Tax=Anaerofustis stercorihominis DSM 17244 TaxID=445971 RepID=B1CA37_9FIRM|nr:type I methionyl aminopeptidase [Anaerofustis stercorihominis]EDS72355.1 methionine aminopeptidase, type I [Anaerofustis stercorihominis DSM 17244]MCQ4795501.1 type I methionyl aminopeptidase [Anaerofustis stercorihominis]